MYDQSHHFQLSEQCEIILKGTETVKCNTKLTNTAKDILNIKKGQKNKENHIIKLSAVWFESKEIRFQSIPDLPFTHPPLSWFRPKETSSGTVYALYTFSCKL